MGIKEVIETINRMQADAVVERYAVGGAVAATFYLEPVATLDVDVFVEFHTESGARIVSPEPIFKYKSPLSSQLLAGVVVTEWSRPTFAAIGRCEGRWRLASLRPSLPCYRHRIHQAAYGVSCWSCLTA